jgi:hypothetical protein
LCPVCDQFHLARLSDNNVEIQLALESPNLENELRRTNAEDNSNDRTALVPIADNQLVELDCNGRVLWCLKLDG